MQYLRAALLLVFAIGPPAVAAQRSDTPKLLGQLQGVAAEGRGHAKASAAWRNLAQLPASELPAILTGLDDANPLAANWIRAAVDAVAERQLQTGGELPVDGLLKFLRDTQHAPRARRLAYEWLVRVDPATPDRLLPELTDDPSLELRRDAVERLVQAAEQLAASGDKPAAVAAFRRALEPARDLDQVTAIAKRLKGLESPVELARHFGFITKWRLIGPFDNGDKKGFAVAYPPESAVDPAATLDGASGPVQWIEHETADELGIVDLNKAIGKLKGAVAYAWCEFHSERAQPAEVRFGSINANKVWLNGELLAAADVYHAYESIDQYVGKGKLKQGRNEILIKVCQNEQTEEWAQNWMFQLRVCDALGKAIHSAR